MNWKAALVMPFALSLSMASMADPGSDTTGDQSALIGDGSKPSLSAAEQGIVPSMMGFDARHRAPENFQVRIEQRVIVRIAPRSSTPRQSLTAELESRPASPPRMVEKRMDDCLDLADIAGVQTTRDDRLLLYLRDRRLIAASLEKSCRARDFYSGFYVERNKDGRICRKRDKLLSRSGVNCEIDRLRQLVADEAD